VNNCDSCVGVEAEHHQCDECVQDDIAAERALRAELVAVKAKNARQRAEIRRLRKALTTISNPDNWGSDGGWDEVSYPDEIAREALATKRGK
jgi:hypothetical protein